MQHQLSTKTFLSFIFACFFLLAFLPTVSTARSLAEIEEELADQSEKLDEKESALSEAQKRLDTTASDLDNAEGEIPRLEAEIKQMEAQIEYNQLEIQLLEEQKRTKELEQEKRLEQQDQSLKQAYFGWRTRSLAGDYISTSRGDNPLKKEIYQAQVLQAEERDLEQLAGDILGIRQELGDYESENKSLQEQTEELEQRKRELEQQVQQLKANLTSTQSTVSSLRGQVGALQSEVEQLQKEQKEIQNYEAWLMAQDSGGGGNQTIAAGEFFFSGQGRDLYQGHGVGLSQFGAYGAALNGWDAEKIVEFYYQDTRVEKRGGSVSVQGYGTMDVNDYLAGLGEVPDKACGNSDQVAERPDKYTLDNPNTVWDCWPEEAIKAQIIVARSYALRYNGTICTNANCQVYVGGNAKQWAAVETKDEVAISTGSTHNGQIINAVYSSDNNQGNGTANNDTIFSDMSGDGTPYSYLRHRDDTGVAYNFIYTDWTWRTNGYTMEDIDDMLAYVNRDSSLSYARGFINSIRSDIGQVANVSFERGPSQRVKKVVIDGTQGTRKMAGWLFKAIWNSWVYNEKPSGEVDYIYSLTIYKGS